MKTNVFLFAIFLCALPYSKGQDTTTPAPGESCGCGADKMEICGSDGRTYDNSCKFECAKMDVEGLTKHGDGQCAYPPLNCTCGRNLSPWCGSDGRTYANECLLQCAQKTYPQMKPYHRGFCRRASG